MVDRTAEEIVTLWHAAGPAELAAVAASRWRAWPPAAEPVFRATLDRPYATEIAREWCVAHEGAGHVVAFDVRRAFLDRHDVHRVDDTKAPEYRIPGEAVADLNRNIVGAIRELVEYSGPVPDADFEAAALHFDAELPPAWRAYLQGRSWFRRGWLTDAGECYLWLHPPDESVELTRAWGPSTPRHPGIAFIGGDGARECLALDLRLASPPVVTVPIVSVGWQEAFHQADTVGQFVERVEDGSFEFRFS